MKVIPDTEVLQERVGQYLLAPFQDANSLARRYRDIDAFHNYVGQRTRLVMPALALILVTGLACGMSPVMALMDTNFFSAVAGLLLVPVMLIGSLFVLALVFFSWLEERSIASALRRRTGRKPKPASSIREKLSADLGRPPRVPWLHAAVFVALPLATLLHLVPVIAGILVALLVATPFAFALLDQ